MSSYELRLTTATGATTAILDAAVSFEYTLALHQLGVLVVTLPASLRSLLGVDSKLEVWRSATGGAQRLERVYLVRRLVDRTDAQGRQSIEAHGVDGNWLLAGRIVAYAAGSAQANKTGAADDVMKAIVRENLGALATDADRNLTGAGFSVNADLGLGPALTRTFARQNVLSVLTDLADAARQAGTPVYFDVHSPTRQTYAFRTAISQLGTDRTLSTATPALLLGVEYGNLGETTLERDWSSEASVVYVGGQGEEAQRTVSEVEATARSTRSVWARRELWADARGEAASAALTAIGQQTLTDHRARLKLQARLLDVPGAAYGLDWFWGDRVTLSYLSTQYEAVIRAVNVKVDAAGREVVTARLEAEE